MGLSGLGLHGVRPERSLQPLFFALGDLQVSPKMKPGTCRPQPPGEDSSGRAQEGRARPSASGRGGNAAEGRAWTRTLAPLAFLKRRDFVSAAARTASCSRGLAFESKRPRSESSCATYQLGDPG